MRLVLSLRHSHDILRTYVPSEYSPTAYTLMGPLVRTPRRSSVAPPRFSVNLMPVRGSEKSAAHERMAVSKTRKRDIVGDGISRPSCATTSRGVQRGCACACGARGGPNLGAAARCHCMR